jgi:hypothetical protein
MEGGTPPLLPTAPQLNTYVTTSLDGSHWSAPVQMGDCCFDDFDTILADSAKPGRAYVTWMAPGFRQVISVTNDFGRTFSPPSAIAPTLLADEDPGRLLRLSDGSLLDLIQACLPADCLNQAGLRQAGPLNIGGGHRTLYAIRGRPGALSAAGQLRWSAPVVVADQSDSTVVDPGNSTVYEPGFSVLSAASGATDLAVIAWTTSEPKSSTGAVHVATSSDGFSTKSIVDLTRPAQVYDPTVAVGTDTTIAVMWYEVGKPASDGTLPTTLQLALSHDGGKTLSTPTMLAGPFDLRSAKPVGGSYLGDYQSLAPTSNGFEAAFTLARPQATSGVTAIFGASIPGRPHLPTATGADHARRRHRQRRHERHLRTTLHETNHAAT